MLSLTASIETLRQRIVNRRAEGVDVSDADLQILDDQLASQDPLSEAERAITLTVETDHPGCWVSALSEIRREFGRE